MQNALNASLVQARRRCLGPLAMTLWRAIVSCRSGDFGSSPNFIYRPRHLVDRILLSSNVLSSTEDNSETRQYLVRRFIIRLRERTWPRDEYRAKGKHSHPRKKMQKYTARSSAVLLLRLTKRPSRTENVELVRSELEIIESS